MADYSAQIRLGIQGLGQLNQFNTALERASELLGNLENAQIIAGQIGQSATRNVNAAARRRAQAGRDLANANRTVAGTAMRRDPATGLFLPGGANATARRMAGAQLRLAQREVRESDRSLREELQNRRLISAAERRYAIAAGEAADAMAGLGNSAREQQARLDQTMRNIGQGSRGNYLTNLFQGRQAELARGGGGRDLSPELQQQARNARAAWDLATAGGRENLQLMQRLATEMAGLVRQQNEFNRRRTGRVGSYETGRRGQERITELSRMAGADPAVIRRLRSRATEVISTGFGGDTATSRLATLRMNAAIDRYRRELTEAANQLQQQRRASFRDFNIRQNWRAISAEIQKQNALAPVQRNIDLSQAGRQASNFGFGLAGDAVAKSIRRSQEKRAIAEAKLAAIAEAEAAAREALLARIQKNIGLSQVGREASNFGFGLAGDAVAKSIRRNQEKRAIAEAKLAAAAEAEAAAREALLARVQKNIDLSQASRQASNFGFGSADDAVAKSIRRNREKTAQATAREAAAAAKSANQANAAARAAEFRRTGGLSFEERLARIRPDLAPGAAKPAPGFFRGDARKAIGEGLIGGAFPLLFGQGAGASVGGLAGGALGGAIGGSFGFGLSLAGTALGTAVDTTAQNLKDLAAALKSPTDAIAALETSGYRVGDSLKFQVQQLQAVGRSYDAQTLVLQEVQRRLGPGSITELRELDAAQKRLQESWAAIGAQIQTRLLPVLQGFVEFLGGAAGDISGFASQSRLQRLDPETFNRLRDQATKEVFSTKSGIDFSGDKTREQVNKRLNELAKQELSRRFPDERAQVPLTPQDAFADINASIALNESRKAGNREYASLVRETEDFRRDSEEKIFQMRRQGVDIEKQKTDLRLEVESKIFDMRQETAKLEIENARSRAQLAIQSFDLELAQRADMLGGDTGKFIDQVREYLRVRDEGESELQAKEKISKLQIAASERDLQKYILQVSDKVAAIARTVEDYKRDQAKFRFESSRRLEDYRIKVEDYIYGRFKERYEYAIGSEQEILQIRMQAAAAMGAPTPLGAQSAVGGLGAVGGPGATTAINAAGLANPLGPQKGGRPPNWNQGLGAGRGHQGQDVGVDVGTTIHAIEDAVVEGIIRGFSRDGNPKAGDAVMLRYLSGQLGVYGHIKPGVSIGERVKAGQQIGVVSDWGQNTHLHYELWKRRRGARGDLLDPSERLRSALWKRRRPPAPAVRPPFRGFNSSALPDAGLGNSFLSLLGDQGGFEDVAGLQPLPLQRMLQQIGRPLTKIYREIQDAANTAQPYSRREIREMLKPDPKRREQILNRAQEVERVRQTWNPIDAEWKERDNRLNPKPRSKPSRASFETFSKILHEIDKRAYGRARKAGVQGDASDFLTPDERRIIKSGLLEQLRGGKDPFTLKYGSGAFWVRKFIDETSKQLVPKGARPPATSKPVNPLQDTEDPWVKRFLEQTEPPRIVPGVQNRIEGASLPGMGFDVSKIERSFGDTASIASDSAGSLFAAQPLPVDPFKEGMPTYGPAPMVAPVMPTPPELPTAPAPMVTPDTSSLTKELGKQRDEILENIELVKKLQELENGRLLLQLGSSREARDRLNDAARELFLETELLGVDRSLSQSQQEIGAEKIRTAFAAKELNNLEEESLGFAKELLDTGKLQQQEYDQITQGIRDRIGYEKELLEITKDRAEVARQEAFNQRSGDLERETRLVGAGLRAGLAGAPARAFEAEMALSGDVNWANKMAELSKRLENQQLVWQNLEKNIVDVSDAISGALTNGLLDIVSGARKIEDVGRDMLNGIARSFADSAQQQLTTLMQRQLAQFAGPKLAGMLGAGAEAAGPQALGMASLTAAGQVAAFGAMVQTVMGQMALSGVTSGLGSAPSLLGSTLPAFVPGLSPTTFGGFFANGGTARPGKGYVVGENEPEFFFPGVSGRVVPRSDMEKAEALREGSEQNEPIDVRYTVTEQRGERYVTEEQFRRGMAETSKRAQAMTYAGMRNNKEVRSFVDI